MELIEDLKSKITCQAPRGLVIGSFDGLHRGHRLVLDRLRQIVGPTGTVAVFTFINHPSSFFKRDLPGMICSNKQKIKLLEKAGVDLLFWLPFDEEIANLSYRAFLEKVRAVYPFTHLVRGEGDRIGKNREGDEDKLRSLALEWGFELDVLSKLQAGSETISSGLIRKKIQSGELAEVARLLGRPYSIQGYLNTEGLCLPPDGDYLVEVHLGEKKIATHALIKGKKIEVSLPLSFSEAELVFYC